MVTSAGGTLLNNTISTLFHTGYTGLCASAPAFSRTLAAATPVVGLLVSGAVIFRTLSHEYNVYKSSRYQTPPQQLIDYVIGKNVEHVYFKNRYNEVSSIKDANEILANRAVICQKEIAFSLLGTLACTGLKVFAGSAIAAITPQAAVIAAAGISVSIAIKLAAKGIYKYRIYRANNQLEYLSYLNYQTENFYQRGEKEANKPLKPSERVQYEQIKTELEWHKKEANEQNATAEQMRQEAEKKQQTLNKLQQELKQNMRRLTDMQGELDKTNKMKDQITILEWKNKQLQQNLEALKKNSKNGDFLNTQFSPNVAEAFRILGFEGYYEKPSKETVNAAYKAITRAYHPDKHSGADKDTKVFFDKKTQKIISAIELLRKYGYA